MSKEDERSKLLDLPEEMLVRIFSCLNKQSLWNLWQVCIKLRSLRHQMVCLNLSKIFSKEVLERLNCQHHEDTVNCSCLQVFLETEPWIVGGLSMNGTRMGETKLKVSDQFWATGFLILTDKFFLMCIPEEKKVIAVDRFNPEKKEVLLEYGGDCDIIAVKNQNVVCICQFQLLKVDAVAKISIYDTKTLLHVGDIKGVNNVLKRLFKLRSYKKKSVVCQLSESDRMLAVFVRNNRPNIKHTAVPDAVLIYNTRSLKFVGCAQLAAPDCFKSNFYVKLNDKYLTLTNYRSSAFELKMLVYSYDNLITTNPGWKHRGKPFAVTLKNLQSSLPVKDEDIFMVDDDTCCVSQYINRKVYINLKDVYEHGIKEVDMDASLIGLKNIPDGKNIFLGCYYGKLFFKFFEGGQNDVENQTLYCCTMPPGNKWTKLLSFTDQSYFLTMKCMRFDQFGAVVLSPSSEVETIFLPLDVRLTSYKYNKKPFV